MWGPNAHLNQSIEVIIETGIICAFSSYSTTSSIQSTHRTIEKLPLCCFILPNSVNRLMVMESADVAVEESLSECFQLNAAWERQRVILSIISTTKQAETIYIREKCEHEDTHDMW